MMFKVSPPLLVVVTGMPSSGKTTIAESVSRRLRLPLISKDEIKERLYDALGSDDVASSSQLGTAAYALIFVYARALLASGVTTMVEANFFRGQEEEFQALPEHRAVQIHCEAPLAILLDRYASRARHPGHDDREKINELAARFEDGAHAPLRLDGDLIRLDTTRQVDEAVVADLVRERLPDEAGYRWNDSPSRRRPANSHGGGAAPRSSDGPSATGEGHPLRRSRPDDS